MVLLDHTTGSFQSRFLTELASRLWFGVDIFFVLSGFLITRILLAARGSQTYFSAFYMRRVLRIWPLYFCVLLAGFLLFYLHGERRPWAGVSPWPFILFVQNLQSVSHLWRIKQLDVTWSLAVEEQFYLIWPLIVAAFSPKKLLWICLSLFALSPCIRMMFILSGCEAPTLYYNTLCRIDGLAAGACLALCCYYGVHVTASFRRLCVVFATIGIPAAFAAAHSDAFLGNVAPWTFSITALAAFGLVGIGIHGESESLFHRLLRNSVVQYIGEVSYGLYLLHRFVLIPLTSVKLQWIHNSFVHDAAIFLLGAMLCLLLASSSWHCMEKPLLGLKKHFGFGSSASDVGLSPAAGLQPSSITLTRNGQHVFEKTRTHGSSKGRMIPVVSKPAPDS